MRVDLHNHTLHSDGVYTARELVLAAKRENVDVFALTDHDSVFGIEEILNEAQKEAVKVIAGIELSTFYKGQTVHIVCLFKNNIVPKSMIKFSIDNKNNRINRAIKMMNNIKEIYNLEVDIDELLKTGEVITRGNMLRNIAKCNNMSFEEAKFYISEESKAYIPSSKLDTKDGLKIAREANAIAILAHPCLIKKEYVEEIASLGFDGIEARYPYNKEHDEEYFKELALKYNLFISAGSDCHGDKTHANIGTSVLNDEEFMPIAEKLGLKEIIYGN